jgi:Xaa-Pro aminopeptidase
MVHNLQILQSGRDTAMVHRRPTLRQIEKGDPVYLCFCGLLTYKNYKPGFDREFFVGTATEEQAKAYEVTVRAQSAALNTIKPGVIAEDVHFAAEAVYRAAGFAPAYRTGRAIGCSIIEKPELKAGDKTVLRAGMTFAVDGGITVAGKFGTRVGDSIVVTNEGFECLTPYPKEIRVL